MRPPTHYPPHPQSLFAYPISSIVFLRPSQSTIVVPGRRSLSYNTPPSISSSAPYLWVCPPACCAFVGMIVWQTGFGTKIWNVFFYLHVLFRFAFAFIVSFVIDLLFKIFQVASKIQKLFRWADFIARSISLQATRSITRRRGVRGLRLATPSQHESSGAADGRSRLQTGIKTFYKKDARFCRFSAGQVVAFWYHFGAIGAPSGSSYQLKSMS